MKVSESMETEGLLKTKEVLAILGICRSTLYKFIERGLLHPVANPVGHLLKRRKLRFSQEEIEGLINTIKPEISG